MKKPLLKFRGTSHSKTFKVFNHNEEELGFITHMRVGQFLHWTFHPQTDTFYTNGCLKEISDFITNLYRRDERRRIRNE